MNEELNGQTNLFGDDTVVTEEPVINNEDALRDVIKDSYDKIRLQAMLLGAQTTLRVVLDKIDTAMNQPGKRSMNDYKRLVKEITNFCVTGLSKTVNADGTTSDEDETTQN